MITASSVYSVDIPTLEILVGGVVVSSSLITSPSAQYVFTLDFTGTYPSSLQFRFNDGLAEGGRSIALEEVLINGQTVDPADLTATILSQSQTSSMDTLANDHLFGRVEPSAGDLGTPTQTGTGGDDFIQGGKGADVIDGGNGADRIRGIGDDDAINGGAGDDYITGENGNDIIMGGAGNDLIFGGNDDDIIYGQDDNDVLIGDNGDDILNGGLGDDFLLGDNGNDILFGEAGADTLVGDNGDDILYGDDGDDILSGDQGADRLYGGIGNDYLYGGAQDDVLYGESGNDFLMGEDGNDIIDGGANDDFVFGGDGNDTISGGTGNDQLFGGAGNDTISGDAGDDSLIGGDGADTLNGGVGNDILKGSGLTIYEVSAILAANPNVVFSEDTNSFYQLVSSAITFAGAQGVAGATTLNGVAGHLVTISSQIENDFVDALAAGNQVWINASDSGVEGEWRWAGGQEDGLLLWNGDQTGSAANGFFTNWAAGQPGGGASNDAAVMLANGTWDDVNAGGTNYYVIEWDGSDFSDDNAADTLNGGANDDILFGDGGNDILNGDDGIDHLFGGAGDDTMNGGNGDDFLYDDAGGNTFNGGIGNDTLDARFQTAIPSIANQIATVLSENPGVVYSVDTGNFYQVVTSTVDWDVARAAAASASLNGLNGHLATITSQAEHDFIVSLAIGVNTWLGGTDAASITGDASGEWYWVEGPEAGTHFYSEATGLPVGGEFTNWNPGQPNDSNNTQNYLYLLNSNNGWADLVIEGDGSTGYVTVGKYLIEWEGADFLITPPTEAVQSGQIMYGGAGDDLVYGGNGGDQIYGEADNDTLYGLIGSDTIYGGAGADVLYANTAPSLSSIPLNATFNAGSDGFAYADGAPWGGGDGGGVVIDGNYIAGDGYAPGSGNGSIEVNFNTTGTHANSSGSWSITVNLASAMNAAQLSFAYRMNLATQADNNENLYLYADIGGTQYGTGGNAWVNSRIGNVTEGDSGWLTVTLDIGALGTGNHTITLGGLYTQANNGNEDAWIRFDDVTLSNAGAGSEDGSAVNLLDGGDGNDTLYGSTGTDTLLGGNGNDVLRSGSAAGYTVADALAENPNATYYAATGNFYEYVNGNTNYAGAVSGASSSTLNAVAGHLATITSAGENAHIFGIIGADSWLGGDDTSSEGDFYWNAGPDAGTQFWTGGAGGSAVGGMYANWQSGQPNDWGGNQDHFQIRLADGTWADFTNTDVDDYVIEWEGSDVLVTGNTTTLDGGAGNDTLYGSDGEDVFVLGLLGSADSDDIEDFDSSIDKIDLSDLLTAYNPMTDLITDFVQITTAGGDSVIRVDTAGGGNFGGAARVAGYVIGVTGLTDEVGLEAAGTLITA